MVGNQMSAILQFLPRLSSQISIAFTALLKSCQTTFVWVDSIFSPRSALRLPRKTN